MTELIATTLQGKELPAVNQRRRVTDSFWTMVGMTWMDEWAADDGDGLVTP